MHMREIDDCVLIYMTLHLSGWRHLLSELGKWEDREIATLRRRFRWSWATIASWGDGIVDLVCPAWYAFQFPCEAHKTAVLEGATTGSHWIGMLCCCHLLEDDDDGWDGCWRSLPSSIPAILRCFLKLDFHWQVVASFFFEFWYGSLHAPCARSLFS